MNTNSPEWQTDSAIKDRCIIGRFTLSERDDKKLLDVLSVPVDESLRGLQQFHILRSQRRQYIFARIGKMIEMKQLPEVNLSLAHTYVKLILQRAHKVNENFVFCFSF